jgi:hypothetical protein
MSAPRASAHSKAATRSEKKVYVIINRKMKRFEKEVTAHNLLRLDILRRRLPSARATRSRQMLGQTFSLGPVRQCWTER